MGSTSSYGFSSLVSVFFWKKGNALREAEEDAVDDRIENAFPERGAPKPIDYREE